MSPETQTALWGIATVIPFAINMASRRSVDAIGISGMLVLIWAFDRVCWVFWTPPQAMALYPLLDACAGATCYTAYITRKAWWKAGLVLLFAAQLVLHFDFWLAWPGTGNLGRYIALNNAVYAAQLVLAAYMGAKHVVQRLLSWRLPARFRSLRDAGG